MRESKYLRLALLFGDNRATTFSKNLEKMIALVLYDNYGKSLFVVEIIDELKNSYGLDFSETEVVGIINGKKQNQIICIEENKDNAQSKYSITPKAKASIDAKVDSQIINDAINHFLLENRDIRTDEKTFKDVLEKYFYSVFNSNATTISELLAGKPSSALEDDVSFLDEQKEQINAFLEWNNKEKDQCVYQMVSCCFDYCMMTVKRDKNIYQNMFRQKRFYLDTNIIFRMMGLNRENRKKLIDTFIRKCKEVGIDLRYTNHTRKEINDTIERHVKKIRDLLNKKEPISVESLRVFSSKYYNLSFYEAYVSWCDDATNVIGDYTSFATDLKLQANAILREFEQRNFDSYDLTKPVEFAKYCDSLKNQKIKKRGYATDEVVQADINNFMYIRDLNKRDNASDFNTTHNYLISTDHILSDWARAISPESIPIVVLPSVWYSLILQYTGRADDDFASFTRFLNFSLSSLEEEENPRKIAILKKVIDLNEPKEIIERTIFDIETKLQTDYKDLDSVDEIVETSHEFILDQERARITEEIQREADSKMASKEADLKAVSSLAVKEKQTELLEERARHAQAEFDAAQEREKLLNNINQAHEQGAKETVERLAKKALKRTMILYWVIAGAFLLLFCYCAMVFIDKHIDGQWIWLPKAYEKLPAIIDALTGGAIAVVGFVVYKKLLCELDKDKVLNRLIDRFSK